MNSVKLAVCLLLLLLVSSSFVVSAEENVGSPNSNNYNEEEQVNNNDAAPPNIHPYEDAPKLKPVTKGQGIHPSPYKLPHKKNTS